MPDTAAPPDRLSALDPEMLDDLVPDWPELEDAVLADREPGDADLADWDPEDPAPERPEAGGREVLKAGAGTGHAATAAVSLRAVWPTVCLRGPCWPALPRTPGPPG